MFPTPATICRMFLLSPLPLARFAMIAAVGGWLSLAARPIRGQAPEAASQNLPVSAQGAGPSAEEPAEVTRYIRDLDDDRFAVREAAQQRLLAAGPDALDAVALTASTGSLEASTRAVSILLHWSQSEDRALSLGALEVLAALTNRPAESAMASEKLADVREKAAMEQLVALGGRVEYDRQVVALGPPGLQVIIGPKWTGGINGMESIAAVRRATTLSFHTASIDVDQAVTEIPTFRQLQRIEFYGTPISEESLAKLRAAMPTEVLIDVRSGARLGIAGELIPGGAGVREVQPGSAAEKAGLAPGDVITEISGVAVADFDALTREIAKAQPGDAVRLKVLRGVQPGQAPPAPIEVEVKFDQWGDDQAVNPGAPSPLGGVPLGMPTRVFINRR
jgi:hypothetical protein